jgi:hypothetical protein
MLVDMATLYIRNVPDDLWAELRASALRNGRSLNAEVIARLRGDTHDWHGDQEWWDRFMARRERWRVALADAPLPEDLIRDDRDSR